MKAYYFILLLLSFQGLLIFSSIRNISSTGNDIIIAGSATLEEMKVTTLIHDLPANDGISIDDKGQVYVSNFATFGATSGTGTTLLKVNPEKKTYEVYVEGLLGPTGNAVDQSGNVYVVSNVVFNIAQKTVGGDVLKILPDGSKEILASLKGYLAGLALDSNNNVYISNYTSPVVHKIASNGKVSVLAEDPRLLGGVGIAVDDNGNVLVGNLITGDILSINKEGVVRLITTVPTVVEGSVVGYITYYAGFIYATAGGANVIYKISLEGEATIFAGNGTAASVDGPLLESSFNSPNGIALDAQRKRLYVTELGMPGRGKLRTITID